MFPSQQLEYRTHLNPLLDLNMTLIDSGETGWITMH